MFVSSLKQDLLEFVSVASLCVFLARVVVGECVDAIRWVLDKLKRG